MKAVKLLALVLILPWMSGAATLHLKKRSIVPEGTRAVMESPGPQWTSGRSHLILQFRHAVNEEILEGLNRRGAYVLGAIPDFGVTVSAPEGFTLEGLDVVWAGRLSLQDKISRLLENPEASSEIWVVAEFFADVDMQEARRLAEAAGFQVHEHPDLIETHLLLSGSSDRLSGLAQWDEVAYVFPASRALIRGERVEHCAGSLTAGGAMPMFVTASSGWAKDASGQVTLSYVFGYLTPKLDPAQATQTIVGALNAWTKYAPIKFVPGQSPTGTRTVYIWFATGSHGDGYPFDGPGGILAHTFYPSPPNAESIAGDMHLDGDENWHIGANTDLFTVTVHEAGHALGLAHTDNPAAVMYPYYRLGATIGPDDIAGIQSLYGATAGASTAPVSPVPPLVLTISSPAANSSTTASTVAITGTTTGGQGTVTVTWQTDHGASGTASGTSNWSAAAVPLVVGSNTITVTAGDSSRKAVHTLMVTRTVLAPAPTPGPGTSGDRTPPSLSIISPAATVATTNAANIDVKGTASDNVGVTKVTWQSNAGSGTASGTTNWIASSIPLYVGDNNIIVRAYDAAGNMSWRSVLVIRN